MVKVYIADVRPLQNALFYEEMCAFLSDERKAHADRYKRNEDRCRSAGAGLLLEYGLRQQGFSQFPAEGKTRVQIFSGEHGKPYLEGNPLYVNLSHAGGYVAAAFGREEIGIDLETVRQADFRLAKRFFTDEEYAWLKAVPKEEQDRAFTLLWTKKESYIKAVGRGMSLPLTDFSVVNGEIPFFSQEKPGEYVLSVCGAEVFGGEVTVCEVDLREIFPISGEEQ